MEEPLETIQTIQLVRDTAIHRDANRGNITTVKRIGVRTGNKNSFLLLRFGAGRARLRG